MKLFFKLKTQLYKTCSRIRNNFQTFSQFSLNYLAFNNVQLMIILIHNLMSECKIKSNKASQRLKKRSDLTYKEKICQIQANIEIQPNMEQIKSSQNIFSNTVQCFCKKVTKMKEEALEKATQMIQLLYEQKQQLEKQLYKVKGQLLEKENTIHALNQKIQRQIKQQLYFTPQHNLQSQLLKDTQSIAVNQIFFSFSQPKSRQFKGKSTSDRSTIEIKPGLTISKQLQPWQNKQRIIESLVEVISRQEESINQFVEIKKLINKQLQQSQDLKNQFQFINLQIQEDLQLLQDTENELSEDKLTTVQSQVKIQNTHDLIRKYENTICRFRQYTAFLKASLCEATNFISKLGGFIHTLSSFSQNSLTELSKTLQELRRHINTIVETYQQNQQLRIIIEKLVQNIYVIKANIKIK